MSLHFDIKVQKCAVKRIKPKADHVSAPVEIYPDIIPSFDNWREWLILLQSTRMVDSSIFIAKIGWFYPNRESTFWAMHAILAMRNNKMGHRINKMWTLINKVGHRNVKLVDTYQQLVFKKQQNGSRVLYLQCGGNLFQTDLGIILNIWWTLSL